MKLRWITYYSIVCIFVVFASVSTTFAQSNLKEGNNNYALYSKSGDIKQLEASRKFADAAYKTKRDTLSFKNNLLRALVYSTLAVVDSNRKQKYTLDPLDVAHNAMKHLKDKQLLFDNEPEINHITRNLANGHLIKANRALKDSKYQEAYMEFRKVDSVDSRTYNVKHNLAALAAMLNKDAEAINRYQALLKSSRNSKAEYVHALADIYEKLNDKQGLVDVLVTGTSLFPSDKNILFRLINIYNQIGAYDAIVSLLDSAFRMDAENIELYEIAAYAYEVTGDANKARNCYEKIIQLDRNNFQGNYGLGLSYLKEYLANTANRTAQNRAENYLLRANQIRPSAVNTLKSLSMYYERKGDILQLERVNNTLDQITLN